MRLFDIVVWAIIFGITFFVGLADGWGDAFLELITWVAFGLACVFSSDFCVRFCKRRLTACRFAAGFNTVIVMTLFVGAPFTSADKFLLIPGWASEWPFTVPFLVLVALSVHRYVFHITKDTWNSYQRSQPVKHD